jgi:hypothetical protein
MFKNEEEFERLVGDLKVDTRVRSDHRDDLRRRMLAAFAHEQKMHGRLHLPWRRLMRNNITRFAAAAAVILLAIAFWPEDSRNNIAWADVVGKIKEAKTLVASGTMEIILSDAYKAQCKAKGEDVPQQTTDESRYFYKDPGMDRWERLWSRTVSTPTQPSTTQPSVMRPTKDVTISIRTEDKWTILSLRPDSRWAGRHILIHWPMHDESLDKAADIRTKLCKIASDKTRKIGVSEINGMRVVEFEAPVQAWEPRLPYEGTIRVWASEKTAELIACEMEYSRPPFGMFRNRIYDIQWNVPLSDDLFTLPDLTGWTVVDSVSRYVTFSHTILKGHLTLRVGPKDGPAVLTEQDVKAIPGGMTEEGIATKRIRIDPTWTEAGKTKLRAFTGAHFGDNLIIDFNGEFQYEMKIDQTYPSLLIDVTALNKTLEQFEREYLTSDN